MYYKNMKIVNLEGLLKKTKLDHKASIRRSCLFENKEISYHVAQISKQVNAHFHQSGDEIYQIIKGQELIYTGKVIFHNKKIIKINWQKPKTVKKDDVFNIPAGFAHCLKKINKNKLIITFFCPPEHLKNDRFIVKNPF